ncbi:MAG: hypothetical protein ACLUJC_00095 [Clostridia bacterium]
MKTTEAIALLLQAGGMPVLAHPGKIRGIGARDSAAYWTNFAVLLRELKKRGSRGWNAFIRRIRKRRPFVSSSWRVNCIYT